MTVTIKSSENKQKIINTLKNMKIKGKLNAFKHCGKVKLKEDSLEIQKLMRNEW